MTLQILIPLTREWRLKDLVKEINETEFLNLDVSLLFVLDNSSLKKKRVESYLKFTNKRIKKHRIILFRNGQPAEGNVFERRRRIARVLNYAKEYLNSELTLVWEDDTSAKKGDFKRLFYNWQILKKKGVNIGAVSGLQAGRWAYKIIGAWIVDNIEKPKYLKSIDFTKKEILKKVDATGLYFLLTETKNIKEHEFNGSELGPDVDFGLSLRRKGLEIVIDWTIKLGHVTRDKIYKVDEDCISVIFTKNKKGLWKILDFK